PRSRLNALSRASNGTVDAPNPSMTAALGLIATGMMKKQSPPSYCSIYRRTRSVRTAASLADGVAATGGGTGGADDGFGAGAIACGVAVSCGSGGTFTAPGADQTRA